MTNRSRAQRNTRRQRPYAWLGAGALGVGLALAGAGTAHADDDVADTITAEPRLLRELHAARGPHLPVRLRDHTGLVGPLVIPGVTSCLVNY